LKIVIIGNGISGITAARNIRKLSDYNITVISKESKHFYSRTALMYIYMGHMRYIDTKPYEDDFWKKNNIKLVFDNVTEIDFENKSLVMEASENLKYDKIVLALGSKSNKFGWEGQDLNGVVGLYNLQDLEAIEHYTQNINKAVIVGGGLIGIELAEMLHSRHIPVTMLVREENYWDIVLPIEESKMVSNHILAHGIDLRLSSELDSINGDDSGRVKSLVTKSGESIDCQMVGLTVGVSPNVDFLKGTALKIEKGIVVNDNLETNIADVYAIGDCAQLASPQEGRRPIEAIWYTGKMMGQTVAQNVCGSRVTYDPGIWYNSAKFMDIEYQVYGTINTRLHENEATLYWQHKSENKSIRLNYDKATKEILGFNLMGIRYRHAICEKWIKESTKISEVLMNLSLANFDPEFFKEFEKEIVHMYNQQAGEQLELKSKRSWTQAFSFLNK
jgi:NAD(P)H-nitrite reductase large subunit